MILRTLLYIVLEAALVTVPAAGNGPRDAASLRNKSPRGLLQLPAGSHAVLVEKSTQSLILYRGTSDGLPELVRIVRANTGERSGDKVFEGDLRTPEGIYFFTRAISGRDLPPEYGIRAFVTDFPNAFDLLDGRNGSNIWLHATNEPERVLNGYNTRGCVVVTNPDMEAITPLVRTGFLPNTTSMVVEEELDLLSPDSARSLAEELGLLLIHWEEAWESRDVDRYMAFYSPRFQSGGRDREAQRSYKARLARQYEYIRVTVEDLHLYCHDDELVAAFRQHYKSDRFESRSYKRLYLRRDASGWKIVRETSRSAP